MRNYSGILNIIIIKFTGLERTARIKPRYFKLFGWLNSYKYTYDPKTEFINLPKTNCKLNSNLSQSTAK